MWLTADGQMNISVIFCQPEIKYMTRSILFSRSKKTREANEKKYGKFAYQKREFLYNVMRYATQYNVAKRYWSVRCGQDFKNEKQRTNNFLLLSAIILIRLEELLASFDFGFAYWRG